MFVKTKRIVIPTIIFLAGVSMMILGIQRGELQMIFRKAIVICMECIGIG